MQFLESVKILIVPIISLIFSFIFMLTDNINFLIVSGILLIFFSAVLIILLTLVLFNFGLRSVIDIEIDPISWIIFFLSLIVFVSITLNQTSIF
jgi:hypothetical protein